MFDVTMTTSCVEAPMSPVSNPIFKGRMPLPPGINASYKIVRVSRGGQESGGMRLAATAELQQFKDDAANMLSQAQKDWATINAIRDSKLRAPLAIRMDVYFAPAKRVKWERDLDGVIKAAQDAVFESIELDDKLVDEVHVVAHRNASYPCIEVELRCLLQAQ
jgi:Holliday junction resolvase RusA-like endonuclease